MTAIPASASRARDAAVINARLDRLPKWGLGYAGFAILGLCYLFAFYDIAVFGVALPAIAGTLHLTSGQTSLPVSANLVGYILGALVLGNLSDRFGRRPMLATVVIIIAVTAVATAFSWNVGSLAAFRFGAGVGTGAMITMAATLIGEYAPAGSRGRYLAKNAFWNTIGNIIPAVLAIPLIQTNASSGWRVLLVVPVIIAVLLFFFRDRVLPESPRWLAARGDLARAERITEAMERRNGVAPLDAATAEAAAAEAAAAPETTFARTELLRRPFLGRILVVFGLWFAFYFAMYAMLAYLPTLDEHLGAGVSAANLMTALGFAGGAVIAALQPLWIDRIERKTTIIGGLSVFVIGLVIMAVSNGLAVLIAGSVIANIGAMGGMIPAYAYTAEVFPTRARASAMGLGDGIGHLGGAVQAPIVAALLAASGPRPVLWLLAAAVCVAVGFMFLAVRTTGRTLTDLAASGPEQAAPVEAASA